MRGKELRTVGGAAQELGILEEMSEAEVAVRAEESAHQLGGVGMVDARRVRKLLPAHEAQPVLAREHPVKILL